MDEKQATSCETIDQNALYMQWFAAAPEHTQQFIRECARSLGFDPQGREQRWRSFMEHKGQRYYANTLKESEHWVMTVKNNHGEKFISVAEDRILAEHALRCMLQD